MKVPNDPNGRTPRKNKSRPHPFAILLVGLIVVLYNKTPPPPRHRKITFQNATGSGSALRSAPLPLAPIVSPAPPLPRDSSFGLVFFYFLFFPFPLHRIGRSLIQPMVHLVPTPPRSSVLSNLNELISKKTTTPSTTTNTSPPRPLLSLI